MKIQFNSKQIDLLNVGLIVLSLIIAVYLPFRLFLFSYAVLGPLHYLTEINWLNDKNFFIKNPKKWTIPLILCCTLIGIYGTIEVAEWKIPLSFEAFYLLVKSNYSTLILTGFLFAVSLVFFKKWKQLLLSLFISFILSYALNYTIPKSFILIGIFVPTIIHVYFFTGLFMLWGARKGKSKAGLMACLALGLIPFIIYFIPINEAHYSFDERTINYFMSSNMGGVNYKIAKLFALNETENFVLLSELGIRIQIFIAFAYTYHYLNWFSKTSVIGWKKSLTHKKGYLIFILWFVSVMLYYTNFKIGFIALFLLSFLHVFLEFPLNVITIKELFKRS